MLTMAWSTSLLFMSFGGVVGAGATVFILAAVWLAVALIPLRSPAARRGLAAFVLGVSVLVVAGAGFLASQEEKSSSYSGDSPAGPAMFAVGLLVAPAVIAALVRMARSSGSN
ncbi:hypothetical protein [Streptomyces nigrescens]|uniref:hypothetical protein n=1 Tax=Streptomyces nigrescens TaxID=1920 RepID=UPI0037019983